MYIGQALKPFVWRCHPWRSLWPSMFLFCFQQIIAQIIQFLFILCILTIIMLNLDVLLAQATLVTTSTSGGAVLVGAYSQNRRDWLPNSSDYDIVKPLAESWFAPSNGQLHWLQEKPDPGATGRYIHYAYWNESQLDITHWHISATNPVLFLCVVVGCC